MQVRVEALVVVATPAAAVVVLALRQHHVCRAVPGWRVMMLTAAWCMQIQRR